MYRLTPVLLLACSLSPAHLGDGLSAVVHACDGVLAADGGVFFVHDLVHANVLRDASVSGPADTVLSTDGGLCIRARDAGLVEICTSTDCARLEFVPAPLHGPEVVMFPPVPIGQEIERSIVLGNRTSRSMRLTAVVEGPFAVLTPNFELEAMSSHSLKVSFVPTRSGVAEGLLVVRDGNRDVAQVELFGVAQEFVRVQAFVDAGVVAVVPRRRLERRAFRIVNDSQLGLPSELGQVLTLVDCSPADLSSVLLVELGPVPALEPGASFVADLFLGGGGAGRCSAQLFLGGRPFRTAVLVDVREVEFCSLGASAIRVREDQRDYLVELESRFGRCYLSWPRITGPGAAVISDWTETVLEEGRARSVRVSLDWIHLLLDGGTSLVLDVNSPSGRFIRPIEPL